MWAPLSEVIIRTVRRKSANDTIVAELTQDEWEVVSEREHRLVALEKACEQTDPDDLIPSLQRVTRALPLAADVETVSIRLMSSERDALHLVAREGLPTRHIRNLALEPITCAKQRSIFALAGHHSEARSLGLRYLAGEWIRAGSELIGSLTVGCRTGRKPSPSQRDLVAKTAITLGTRLADVDRSEQRLRTHALGLARAATMEPPDLPDGVLEKLRPREAAVLELYADGWSVDQIAAALVISPHTVRTHIKLAFGRLGIHSRKEAAELVRTNDVMALL